MQVLTPTVASPSVPPPSDPGGGTYTPSVRVRIASWMEEHLGRAAMPVAALAGGLAGGTLGMLTLGPAGAVIGGLAGAFFGAVLQFAG